MTPLQVAAGTGPRHGAFSRDTIAGSYFFYLVGELAGTVTAYRIDYTNSSAGGITFNQVGVYDTLNATAKFPKNPNGSTKVAPAEIALTVSEIAPILRYPLSSPYKSLLDLNTMSQIWWILPAAQTH